MPNKTYFFDCSEEKDANSYGNFHAISYVLFKKMHEEIAANAKMNVDDLRLEYVFIPCQNQFYTTAVILHVGATDERYIYIVNEQIINGTCRITNTNDAFTIKNLKVVDSLDGDIVNELLEIADCICPGDKAIKIPSASINEDIAIEMGYVTDGDFYIKAPNTGE